MLQRCHGLWQTRIHAAGENSGSAGHAAKYMENATGWLDAARVSV